MFVGAVAATGGAAQRMWPPSTMTPCSAWWEGGREGGREGGKVMNMVRRWN